MKRKIILAGIFGLLATVNFAQDKIEVRKEVRLEEHNGEKHLVIVTIENGESIEEVFVGEEADAKLKEIEESMKSEKSEVVEKKEVQKEIKVEIDDAGQKVVTIITNENGNIDEQVFTGPEADKKLKELEEGDGNMKIVIEKEVIKE